MKTMHKRLWPTRIAAFTLLEVLVVTAVLVVLMAMLLPSLQHAREDARRVVCLHNLRQLDLAMFMYQADSHGYFPANAQGSTLPAPNTWCPFNWIAWYNPVNSPNLNNGALVPYMGGKFLPKQYTCPSDDTSSHINYWNGYGAPYRFSYTANCYICVTPNPWNCAPDTTDPTGATGSMTPTIQVRFTAIHSPATKILLIDEAGDTIDDGCWYPPQAFGAGARNVLSNRHDRIHGEADDNNPNASYNNLSATAILHAGAGNVAFVDGHAETVPRVYAMQKYYYYPYYDGPLTP